MNIKVILDGKTLYEANIKVSKEVEKALAVAGALIYEARRQAEDSRKEVSLQAEDSREEISLQAKDWRVREIPRAPKDDREHTEYQAYYREAIKKDAHVLNFREWKAALDEIDQAAGSAFDPPPD